jgi:hypothetical protein
MTVEGNVAAAVAAVGAPEGFAGLTEEEDS